MIKNLAFFLEKFKRLKNPKEEREKIVETIAGVIGFDMKIEDIQIRKDTIFILADNYIRTEIFLKKEAILEALCKTNINIKNIS